MGCALRNGNLAARSRLNNTKKRKRKKKKRKKEKEKEEEKEKRREDEIHESCEVVVF